MPHVLEEELGDARRSPWKKMVEEGEAKDTKQDTWETWAAVQQQEQGARENWQGKWKDKKQTRWTYVS